MESGGKVPGILNLRSRRRLVPDDRVPVPEGEPQSRSELGGEEEIPFGDRTAVV